MRIAILGGTFDPPHIGHMMLAEILHIELGYDRVLLVPSHIPAHKDVRSGTDPEQRLAMTSMAAEGVPYAEVDDCEIRRGGTSYSIDTVRELKQTDPDLEGKPGLIIGDDLLQGFGKWKESSNLIDEAEIIIARRLTKVPTPPAFPHRYLDNPLLMISSTDIRRRINRKLAFRYLVTAKIYSYISDEQLYVDKD